MAIAILSFIIVAQFYSNKKLWSEVARLWDFYNHLEKQLLERGVEVPGDIDNAKERLFKK